MISVRRIHAGEGALFRYLRLASLKESPSAFASTHESAASRSMESWHEQADSTSAGTDRSTFLAFSDDDPVGIMAVYRNGDNRREAELVQVWVSPSLRGSEAARRLLDAALQWCDECGICRLLAAIRPCNERALGFYRKHGFDRAEPLSGNIEETQLLVKGCKTLSNHSNGAGS